MLTLTGTAITMLIVLIIGLVMGITLARPRVH
jgi:hypothetical protein